MTLISTCFILNFSVSFPHQHDTTVSFETNLSLILFDVLMFDGFCECIPIIINNASMMINLFPLMYLGKTVNLNEFEAEAVASLVKLYLRELPENVLTAALLPKFNELGGKRIN